ncbi:hypothetical protein LguiB_012073 [Lonicera macranthoides]
MTNFIPQQIMMHTQYLQILHFSNALRQSSDHLIATHIQYRQVLQSPDFTR